MNQKIILEDQSVYFQELLQRIKETFPKSPGIYSITNTKNGKRYIGHSINLNSRLRNHLFRLQQNKHSNFRLQKAWNHYEGAKVFTIEVLQLFERSFQAHQWEFKGLTNYLPQTLLERQWIEYYRSHVFSRGYNYNIYQGRKEDRKPVCQWK